MYKEEVSSFHFLLFLDFFVCSKPRTFVFTLMAGIVFSWILSDGWKY